MRHRVARVVACCHITTEPKRTPKRVAALCRLRSRRSQPPRQQSTWKGSEEPWACLCSAFASQHDDSSLLSPQPLARERLLFPSPPRGAINRGVTSAAATELPTRERTCGSLPTDVDRTDFLARGLSRGIMSAPQAPVKLRNGVVKQVSIRHRPLSHECTRGSCYLRRVDTLLIPCPLPAGSNHVVEHMVAIWSIVAAAACHVFPGIL